MCWELIFYPYFGSKGGDECGSVDVAGSVGVGGGCGGGDMVQVMMVVEACF